jgi:hypothetical protein
MSVLQNIVRGCVKRTVSHVLVQQGSLLNLPENYLIEEDSENYITEEDNINNILTEE